ncbi:MAG: TIM barrel protein [Acidobacteria bacterium]|nr:TIM barrel protein [Acidobacteriota bacterium]
MTRRQFTASTAAAAMAATTPAARTSMGIATTCYMTAWRPKDCLEFMDHAYSLGAGGVQMQLTSLEPAYLAQVRAKAEQYGFFIEVMGPLPRRDTAQFEAVAKAAAEVKALCLRCACLGGRRYETFATLESWKEFVATSHASIKAALPVVAKHKVRLALENHKDWTAEEFVKLLDHYRDIGVCLDTGNNIALLDDPMELVDALLPYTISTHIKDMAVKRYADGFLLSEVPLGEGYLDIPAMCAKITQRNPKVRFTLEMITRNPLRVPVLTEKYWATFPDRSGRYLARMLRAVDKHQSAKPLPEMDGKDAAAQKKYENDNVKLCLYYARTRLKLT